MALLFYGVDAVALPYNYMGYGALQLYERRGPPPSIRNMPKLLNNLF